MIEIQLADKDMTVEFPDGTPETVMRNAIMREFYGERSLVAPPPEAPATGLAGMVKSLFMPEQKIAPKETAEAQIALEAKEKGQTPEEYTAEIYPEGKKAKLVNDFTEGISNAVKQGAWDTAEMYARSARVLGADTKDLINTINQAKGISLSERKGPVWDSIMQGISSTVQSIGGGLPGMVVGAIGGLAGAVGGFALGAGTLFSLAEYDQFMEEAEQQGLSRDEVRDEAIISAIAEGGIEAATDLIGAKIFGLVGKKALAPAVKEGLLKAFTKLTGKTLKLGAVEVPGEMATSAIQSKERQEAGIPAESPGKAAAGAIGPSIVQTLLMGPLGHGASKLKKGEKPRPDLDAIEKKYKVSEEAGQEVKPEEKTQPGPEQAVVAPQKEMPAGTLVSGTQESVAPTTQAGISEEKIADEESRIKLKEKIESSPEVQITGNEIVEFKPDVSLDLKKTRSTALRWASENIIGEVQNAQTGWDIKIGKRKIDNALHHGSGPQKIQAIAALPELIQNGILLDTRKKSPQSVMTTHVFGTKLRIGEEKFLAGLVIHEDANGRRFYDHELSTIRNLDEVFSQPGATSEDVGRSGPQRGFVNTILRNVWNVKTIKERAQREVSEPAPGSIPATEKLDQGGGVPSDTLHVEPTQEKIAPKRTEAKPGTVDNIPATEYKKAGEKQSEQRKPATEKNKKEQDRIRSLVAVKAGGKGIPEPARAEKGPTQAEVTPTKADKKPAIESTQLTKEPAAGASSTAPSAAGPTAKTNLDKIIETVTETLKDETGGADFKKQTATKEFRNQVTAIRNAKKRGVKIINEGDSIYDPATNSKITISQAALDAYEAGRQRQAEQLAKNKAKGKPSTVRSWVVSKGGIDHKQSSWKGEMKDLMWGLFSDGKKFRINLDLFHLKEKGGKAMDELVAMGVEEGIFPPGTTENDLAEMLRSGVRLEKGIKEQQKELIREHEKTEARDYFTQDEHVITAGTLLFNLSTVDEATAALEGKYGKEWFWSKKFHKDYGSREALQQSLRETARKRVVEVYREKGIEVEEIEEFLRVFPEEEAHLSKEEKAALAELEGLQAEPGRASVSPTQEKAPQKTLLNIIRSLQPAGQDRALVSIAELRDKAGMAGDAFDQALLALAREGKVALHQHDSPASLSEEKRNKLLSVPNPNAYWGGRDYFVGAVPTQEGNKELDRQTPTLTDELAGEGGFIDLRILLGGSRNVQALQNLGAQLSNSRIAHWYNYMRGRTNAGIQVVLKKEHGPQILSSLRNMEGVLSQTAEGRNIYEAGREFKEATIRKFQEWKAQYGKAVEGLDTQEKRAVLNLLDSEEDIQGNHPVEIAAAKVRKTLQEIHEYLVANGKEVSYLEGYLPHIFQGRFWVKGQNEPAAKVETLGEALKLAQEMADRGVQDISVAQDTFIPPDDATMLSKGAYWRLINKIQQEVGAQAPVFQNLTKADIHEMLSEGQVARPKPKKRFFGNQMRRVVNNPNFLKDLDKVMEIYFYGASRKVSQDIFMKDFQKNIDAMPAEDKALKQFAENVYLPGVLAHPTRVEEAIGRALQVVFPGASGHSVRRGFHKINLVQYVMDLGLSFSSCVANGTQFMINAYPVVGERSAGVGYRLGVKALRDLNLMKELEQEGITASVSSITGEVIISKDAMKDFLAKLAAGKGGIQGFQEATLMPFSTVEMVNRGAAYFAGKHFAKKELGRGRTAEGIVKKANIVPETANLFELARELDARLANTTATRNASWRRKTEEMKEHFVRRFGYELNEKTNFRVGRENLPELLRQPLVRLLSPYKSFVLNQLKYTVDTLSPSQIKNNPKKATRFILTTMALAGVAGNPILYGLFLLGNELFKKLFGLDLEKELRRRNLHRGISGKLGVDISGSVAMQLPDPKHPEEFLGRFGKLGTTGGKWLSEKVQDLGTIKTERKFWRLVQPAAVQRILDAVNILESGQYVTPITKTPVTLKETPGIAAAKKAVGIMPSGVSQVFEKEQELQEKQARFKSLSSDYTERWAMAVKENDAREIAWVINKVSKRMADAADRLSKARTGDERQEALTELLFWKSWAENQEKFKEALARKNIPKDVQIIKRAPKYLKPEAAAK